LQKIAMAVLILVPVEFLCTCCHSAGFNVLQFVCH